MILLSFLNNISVFSFFILFDPQSSIRTHSWVMIIAFAWIKGWRFSFGINWERITFRVRYICSFWLSSSFLHSNTTSLFRIRSIFLAVWSLEWKWDIRKKENNYSLEYNKNNLKKQSKSRRNHHFLYNSNLP